MNNDNNSGSGNTGSGNTGDWNSGYWNSGYANSGNWNSGDRNSGYGNSADRQSGIFNNQEGTVRCFNKDTNLKWSEIDHPNFSRFYLNRWVEKGDMTEQEKKDNPEFSTTGGYLKTFTYEEAWANFWRDTTEENKQRILKLPNFDAEVFKDITGIDVEEPEEVETITIGGVEYNRKEVEDRLKDIKPVK